MSYIGKEPEFTSYPSKFFNGDGTAMTVSLDYGPPNDAALLVFIDGVRQDTGAYSVAGTSLTFSGNVPSGTNNVQVVHLGLTVDVGTPGDGTVTIAKLATSTGIKSDRFTVPSASSDLSTPASGDLYFNTTDNALKVYDGSNWAGLLKFAASGGTEVTSGGYKYHTFTSSGTFTVNSGSRTVEYLVVAGGGGPVPNTDHSANAYGSGGGGAGGMITGTMTFAIGDHTVTIGAGGSASNGSNTLLTSGSSSVTAIGGGAGSGWSASGYTNGIAGGSGGGAGWSLTAGAGTSGQGNAGGTATAGHGNSAGGGGKSAVGDNASTTVGAAGGAGEEWPPSSGTYYAGGGGGGTYNNIGTGGAGGVGGGGTGGRANTVATNGSANTGGGGGGAEGRGDIYNVDSGNGGSGIVIIRYAV